MSCFARPVSCTHSSDIRIDADDIVPTYTCGCKAELFPESRRYVPPAIPLIDLTCDEDSVLTEPLLDIDEIERMWFPDRRAVVARPAIVERPLPVRAGRDEPSPLESWEESAWIVWNHQDRDLGSTYATKEDFVASVHNYYIRDVKNFFWANYRFNFLSDIMNSVGLGDRWYRNNFLGNGDPDTVSINIDWVCVRTQKYYSNVERNVDVYQCYCNSCFDLCCIAEPEMRTSVFDAMYTTVEFPVVGVMGERRMHYVQCDIPIDYFPRHSVGSWAGFSQAYVSFHHDFYPYEFGIGRTNYFHGDFICMKCEKELHQLSTLYYSA